MDMSVLQSRQHESAFEIDHLATLPASQGDRRGKTVSRKMFLDGERYDRTEQKELLRRNTSSASFACEISLIFSSRMRN